MDEARLATHKPYDHKGPLKLDGRRVDPASVNIPAGAPRELTAHILNQEEVPEKFDSKGMKLDDGFRIPRMTIEMVPHKKLLAHEQKGDFIRHVGERPEPTRTNRRLGYSVTANKLTFTWNECTEKGFSPKVPLLKSKSCSDLTANGQRRMHTSCKGEKRYNVCGVEDLRPTATSFYLKSDVPPSARHVFENDRNE